MWPNDLIFRSTFLSTFQLLIFPQCISTKKNCHHKYFPLIGTLLRILALDLLDKVAKRVDFHPTTVLLLDFFDKDQTSLDSFKKVAKRLDFLSSKRSSEKSSRLARA